MSRYPKQGLVTACVLTEEDRAEVRQLAALCDRYEGLDLPVQAGPPPVADETNEFLYYEAGALVGFVSLDGEPEVEVCGMVHPAHRRRGIGRALLVAALAECRRRGASDCLLVCEDASASGRAFVAAVGARYRFSEHRMVLDPSRIAPRPPGGPLQLRQAGPADADTLVRLTAAAFGDPPDEVRRRIERWLPEPDQRFYIATLQGEPVGSLRVSLNAGESRVYIATFGVHPERQGRGYGRQILAETIAILRAEHWQDIRIEVVTENRGALAVYHACGFRETTTYGFYQIDL